MKLITSDTISLYSSFNNLRDAAVVAQNFAEVMDENGSERYITVTLRLAAKLQETEERVGMEHGAFIKGSLKEEGSDEN